VRICKCGHWLHGDGKKCPNGCVEKAWAAGETPKCFTPLLCSEGHVESCPDWHPAQIHPRISEALAADEPKCVTPMACANGHQFGCDRYVTIRRDQARGRYIGKPQNKPAPIIVDFVPPPKAKPRLRLHVRAWGDGFVWRVLPVVTTSRDSGEPWFLYCGSAIQRVSDLARGARYTVR
jgi:hypothetical protein